MATTLAAQRKHNLTRLLLEKGGATSVSKLMGQSSPSFLSQLAGGHRNISDKTARKLEEVTGKPLYWMDEDHLDLFGTNAAAKKLQTAKVSVTFVGEAARVASEAVRENGTDIDPDKFAKIVQILYENALETGKVDKGLALNLLRLAQ